jgi:hypothetical protein
MTEPADVLESVTVNGKKPGVFHWSPGRWHPDGAWRIEEIGSAMRLDGSGQWRDACCLDESEANHPTREAAIAFCLAHADPAHTTATPIDPVKDMYRPDFLTPRDAEQLKALDQRQPSTKGQ